LVEKIISEMTCNALSGTLNRTHLHSASRLIANFTLSSILMYANPNIFRNHHYYLLVFNPLMPTVAMWAQL